MTPPSLFRHRNFMLLFGADTITQLGTHVGRIALPLVAVLVLNASPFETGLLIAAQTAAFLLIGLPAGVWVDRLPRRPILITSDLVRAALFASVPLAWWLDALTLPHLYVVALGSGLATVFFDVAYQSYLPSLVDRDQLVDGNSKLEIIHSGAEVGGRGVGGWLVQILGAPVAVLIDAVSFLGSALLLWRIDAVESIPDRAERRSLLKEIGEGLRFVLSHRILRMITASTAISNFAYGIVGAVELIFLTRIVGLSPGVIGMLFAVAGIGGLVGATLIRPLSRWIGSARIIWVIDDGDHPVRPARPLHRPGLGHPVLRRLRFRGNPRGRRLQRRPAQLPSGHHPGTHARPDERLRALHRLGCAPAGRDRRRRSRRMGLGDHRALDRPGRRPRLRDPPPALPAAHMRDLPTANEVSV